MNDEIRRGKPLSISRQAQDRRSKARVHRKTGRICLYKSVIILTLIALLPACANNLNQASDTPDEEKEIKAQQQIQEEPTTTANAPSQVKAIPPEQVQVSPQTAKIIDLATSGVSEAIVVEYIQKSKDIPALTTDEIVYLHDIGLSDTVIKSMINAASAPAGTGEESAAQYIQTQGTAPAAEPSTTVESASYKPAQQEEYIEVETMDAAPSSEVHYFYRELAPYGTWYEVPDYGWCWQPVTVVTDQHWRPYASGGRWLWTDWGWYWKSDYSWGWAPFHYGRWFIHPSHGWLWAPDTTWGPAWVTWRTSNLHCGWAPLPPRVTFVHGTGLYYNGGSIGISFNFGLPHRAYTFVSYRHFYSDSLYSYCLSSTRVNRIFPQTTIINNYISAPNKVIINEGVDKDRISRYVRDDIQRVDVKTKPPVGNEFVKPDRLVKRDGRPVIYKKQLQTDTPLITNAGSTGHDSKTTTGSHPTSSAAFQKYAAENRDKPTPIKTGATRHPSQIPNVNRISAQSAERGAAKIEDKSAVQQKPAQSNTRRSLVNNRPEINSHLSQTRTYSTQKSAAASRPTQPKTSPQNSDSRAVYRPPKPTTEKGAETTSTPSTVKMWPGFQSRSRPTVSSFTSRSSLQKTHTTRPAAGTTTYRIRNSAQPSTPTSINRGARINSQANNTPTIRKSSSPAIRTPQNRSIRTTPSPVRSTPSSRLQKPAAFSRTPTPAARRSANNIRVNSSRITTTARPTRPAAVQRTTPAARTIQSRPSSPSRTRSIQKPANMPSKTARPTAAKREVQKAPSNPSPRRN
ncbi:MAG: hypothetical protein K9N48_08510 [Verrucomicrobia bacterium]|nr:hypothetical protein [Verrucomicrobiota bacterium]MCF7708221.1 hypothetical protein [Verrucomicrobiota bacterium]